MVYPVVEEADLVQLWQTIVVEVLMTHCWGMSSSYVELVVAVTSSNRNRQVDYQFQLYWYLHVL